MEQIDHKEYYLDNPNDSFFFINSQGKKDALRWFRIRLTNKGDSACYKNWHVDPKTGNTTHCDEIEVKLVDGMQTLKLLEAIGFTDKRIMEKTRQKYSVDGFKIVIDNVKKSRNLC
ncbi:CYTH domain-containing protein [Candidatus Dependentiae bacterium]|nr:CYTH domain-containing protein [Candidatus Dependentiae bacterium]